MANDITVYEHPQFGSIRVSGELFVAQDVAAALGYSNTRDVIIRHVEECDRAAVEIHDGSQRRTMTAINESGLYALIFGSGLAAAREFKHWVTREVLPAIRQHGAYMTPATIESILDNPDTIIQLAMKLKEARSEAAVKQAYIEMMQPKVDFYDQIAGSKDAISIAEVAKVLAIPGVGQNNLFRILRDKKILNHENVPMQEYVDRGYFRVIEQKFSAHGEPRIYLKTLVYQRGMDYIRKVVTSA